MTPRLKILGMLCLCLSTTCYAQLVTSTTMTAQQLVQNVLIGNGVSVSNVVYTGSANAIGFFDGTNCNVGLDSGIVMTTGTVLNNGNGPHGPNNTGSSGIDNFSAGDPLLSTLGGGPSRNAARLEFDFTAMSDSIKFNFVFGSEEYPEFVGQNVNDAFGFFISGNNPNGGQFNNQNIALIPGTTTPVSINTVNAATNNAYYISNGTGSTSPQNSSSQYIQYDGLTTVLTAKSAVNCGDTYHIIILISDIFDGQYDSGVFLEAGSFSSPSVDISFNSAFQGSVGGNDSTLFEGCSGTDIWFVRNDSIAFAQTMPINVSGTATAGLDYSPIPSALNFPAGQDSISIHIDALSDLVTEGLEYVTLTIQIPSNCSMPISDSIRVYIGNTDPLSLVVQDDSVNCGDSISINPTVTGGNPGYSYLWNTGQTTLDLTVMPFITTTYFLEVTDTCGNIVSDSVRIEVIDTNPLSVFLQNDTIACGDSLFINPLVTGGNPGYTYSWSNGQTTPQIKVKPATTTTFTVQVNDSQCGRVANGSTEITVPIITPLTLTVSNDTTINCKNTSLSLSAQTSGGEGSITTTWNNGRQGNSITEIIDETTEFIATVTDNCGSTLSDTLLITLIEEPIESSITGNTEICKGDITTIKVSPTGGTGGVYFFQWESGQTDSVISVSPNKSKYFKVGISDNCGYVKARDSIFIDVHRVKVIL